jgi:hypothetical protein
VSAQHRAERERLRQRWRAGAHAVLDWAWIAVLNVVMPRRRRPSTMATDATRGIGGYPVCITCRLEQHKGCGALVGDPPCGCGCVAAGYGRRAANDRQVRAL